MKDLLELLDDLEIALENLLDKLTDYLFELIEKRERVENEVN